MEDPDDPDRFPPVENDNYRPRPVYDPRGRPRITIGDAARPASKAKRPLAVSLASLLIMLVVLMSIWMMLAKLMP